MRVGRLWLAWAIVVIAVITCAAQQLKIIEKDGHVSPVRAKLTFQNNRTREVVVAGIGVPDSDSYFPHNFFVRTEGGASKRALWIDSLAAIKGLDRVRSRPRSEFTIVLKDGSEVSAMFVERYLGDCNDYNEVKHPDKACSALMIVNQDEGHDRIDMRDLKSVEFLPAPKKDRSSVAERYDNFTRKYRYNVVAHIPLEQPDETPDTLSAR